MPEVPGSVDAGGLRVAIAVAEFNPAITDGLLAGALEALADAGVAEPTVLRVPGAFELPLAASVLVASHDCVVALGAVIEGETDHYEYIATQTAGGLSRIALDSGVPVSFGVLTVRQISHAVERSMPGPGNKGAEAAATAVGMALALRRLRDDAS